MKEVKVYADLCLLINFLMDMGILWTTAKLSGLIIDYRRLIAGSLLGAFYAVGLLFYPFHIIYSILTKILFSAFLVMLALHPKGWQQFKRVFLYFYAVSFTIAGASIAASSLFDLSHRPLPFSYLCLFAGLFCAIIIASYADKYFANHLLPAITHYGVEFHFGNQICVADGFLDTGNGLRDPLSQKPVVVAEYEILRKCLPFDFQLAMEGSGDDNERLEALTRSSWANRLRLVPFSSIGKKNGLMIGIRCDELVVKAGKKKLLHKNLVVGMYLDKLSAGDHYQVLIPSEILRNV